MPDQIDVDFLKNFQRLIVAQVRAGNRFAIVAGGGSVARKYQAALKKFSVRADVLDWIGIEATRLNARLMQSVLPEAELFADPEKARMRKRILIGSGWKPGWSTDYVAVYLAKKFKIGTVINLSNIDYVYDKNPQKFADARPIKKMDWKDFKQMVGGRWMPGANLPFDPIASKLAAENNISVVVMNGGKLDNLAKFLRKKDFKGTIISS